MFSGLQFASTSTVLAQSKQSEPFPVLQIVQDKMKERMNIGHLEFESLAPAKSIKLFDEKHKLVAYLVELQKDEQLAGYMIVDLEHKDVTEFALGSVHPYMNLEDGEQGYYFGQLSYAKKDKKGETIHLRTKKELKESDLTDIALDTVINRTYYYISGVPDYQQNDNDRLVGTESYQESSQNFTYFYNFIIHDNWESTPTDVWLSYGRSGGTVTNIVPFIP